MSTKYKNLVQEFSGLDDDDWSVFNALTRQIESENAVEAASAALTIGIEHPELARQLKDYLDDRIGFVRPDSELFTELGHAAKAVREAPTVTNE